MDKLAKVLITTGAMISLLATMCADSSGIYGYIACMICILGGLIAGIGCLLWILVEKRKQDIIDRFYHIPRHDWLDGDLEILDMEGGNRIANE